jgi:hypothetical protein
MKVSNITTTLAYNLWEGKSQEEIISDIISFSKEIQRKPPPTNPLKPYWSLVVFENMDELKRLETIRKNIPILYNHQTGPIYFIGYRDTDKADRFYMPAIGKILEINRAFLDEKFDIASDYFNRGGNK